MYSNTAQQNTVKIPAAQFRIANKKTIPTYLPQKPHHRRHVQEQARPKKTNRTCKHAKDAIDARPYEYHGEAHVIKAV